MATPCYMKMLRLSDLAAQGVGHELAAVADAQDGHAPGEDFGIHMGGGLQIDGVGAAGEDDADEQEEETTETLIDNENNN